MKFTERRENIRSYFCFKLIYLLAHVLLNAISGQWWDEYLHWYIKERIKLPLGGMSPL